MTRNAGWSNGDMNADVTVVGQNLLRVLGKVNASCE